MSDEQRWTLVALEAGTLRYLARLCVRHQIPKHVLLEVISDDYDSARWDYQTERLRSLQ